MPVNYQPIPAPKSLAGLNTFAALGNLPENALPLIQNCYLTPTGEIKPRKGVENIYGLIPLRVTKFAQIGTKIYLSFDTSQTITLDDISLSPLIVYGSLPPAASYGSSSFSNSPTIKYFTDFTIENIEVITGAATIERAASALGLESKYVFASIFKFDNVFSTDNTQLVPEEIRIDISDYAVEIDVFTATTERVVFAYLPKDSDPGNTYIEAVESINEEATTSDDSGELLFNSVAHPFENDDRIGVLFLSSDGGLSEEGVYFVIDKLTDSYKLSLTQGGAAISYSSIESYTVYAYDSTFEIPLATHALTHSEIYAKIFTENLVDTIELVPSEVRVDAALKVTVVLEGLVQGFIVVTNTPFENSFSVLKSPGMQTIELTGIEDPYQIVTVFAEDAGDWVEIIPESISYNQGTETITITLDVLTGSENIRVIWEPMLNISNIISLTDDGSASLSLFDPNMVVWGIPHTSIYKSSAVKGGFLHFLDSYFSETESKLIAGLGGALYESNSTAGISLPSYGARLRNRVDGSTVLAPLFNETETTRTRGSVFDDLIVDNYALLTQIEFVSAGVVNLHLQFTNKTTAIVWDSTIGPNDLITVIDTQHDVNSGEFRILDLISDSATEVVLQIENLNFVEVLHAEEGILARAAVFSDRLTCNDANTFVEGDTLFIPNTEISLVVSSVDSYECFVNVSELVEFPNLVSIRGRRTSKIIALLDDANQPNVDWLVIGDTVLQEGEKKRQIDAVTSAADTSVVLNITAEEIEIDFGGEHDFIVENLIFIMQADTPNANGEYEVLNRTTTTVVVANTREAAVGTANAVVLGKSIELSESTTWADDGNLSYIQVQGRWLPIFQPSREDLNTVNDNEYKIFDKYDYSEQVKLSSTSLNSNIYATGGLNPVIKYDGSANYRAGLPKIIPSVFMVLDTTIPSITSGFVVPYTGVNVAGKSFTIESDAFKIGDRIYDSTTAAIYTVVDIQVTLGTPNEYAIVVAEDASTLTGTGTLTLVKRHRYYFRFSLIDLNNNVVPSAAVNVDDMFFDQVEAGRIIIKLSNFPILWPTEYSKLRVELFKVVPNTVAPFYRVKNTSIDISYETDYALIIVDDVDDLLLSELDPISTALLGEEVGRFWSQPIAAKTTLAAGNQLLVANLQGEPQIETLFQETPGESIVAADLHNFSMLIKKDPEDAAITGDIENRIGVICKASGAVTITSITDGVFTKVAHGLTDDKWIYLFHSATATDLDLSYCGWFQVNALTVDTFSLIGSGFFVSDGSKTDVDSYIVGDDAFIPVWLGTDYNYSQVDNNTGLATRFAPRRIADAINFVSAYSKYNDKITYPYYSPFVTAEAGGDFPLGTLNFKFKNAATIPSLTVGTIPTELRFIAQSIIRTSADVIGAISYLFPSRVGVSYPNYGEVFDDLSALTPTTKRVIDVNPADKDEIIRLATFLGQSIFGAATFDQLVIVFKKYRIYALDLITGEYKQLNTKTIGAVDAHSITETEKGLLFTSTTGIYRLNLDLKVEFIGRDLQKTAELVGPTQVSTINYASTKLSIVSIYDEEDQTYKTLVYNYDVNVLTGIDSWSEFTNLKPQVFCNLQTLTMFGSEEGKVFQFRDYNSSEDFSDNGASINYKIRFRPENFGYAAVRKSMLDVGVQFNPTGTMENVEVSIGTELRQTFLPMDRVTITEEIGSLSIRFTPPVREATYYQLQIECNVAYSALEIAGVSYYAAVLGAAGTVESITLRS